MLYIHIIIAFSQPATGPSSVCEGSNVTLQCEIVLIIDNATTVQPSVWTRNGVLATNISNHRQVFNSTTGRFTDLLITNVTLADDNNVYTCTDTSATSTSILVLNVTGTFNFYPYTYVSTRMCVHMHVLACNNCCYMY